MKFELKILKTLLPQNARAWFVRDGYFNKFLKGIAQSFEEVRIWFETIKKEVLPVLALISLKDWFFDYGLEYVENDSLELKRERLLSQVYQIGRADKEYILSLIKKLGLENIRIIEGLFDIQYMCGMGQCGLAHCNNFLKNYDINNNYFGYYIVAGTIETVSQIEYEKKLQALKSLLNKVVRATLEPIYLVEFRQI
jgi:hypothetical protein